MKVWIRLGGFITADAKTMADINNGYEDALINAIKKNGFEVNGNAYIPETDVEFELNSMTLK